MNLENLRRNYVQGGLRRKDLSADPIEQFTLWMQQAIDAKLHEPTAMCLATTGNDGQPQQRLVLLKGFDQDGFVFYSNYESDKGQQVEANPKVSLHLPWFALERQVRVCGHISKVDKAQSLAYFQSRPRDSQLGAWASQQSRVVDNREQLMDQFKEHKAQFAGKDIELPPFWGGYQIAPETIEFWQGGAGRMHDRFLYRKQGEKWMIERLSP